MTAHPTTRSEATSRDTRCEVEAIERQDGPDRESADSAGTLALGAARAAHTRGPQEGAPLARHVLGPPCISASLIDHSSPPSWPIASAERPAIDFGTRAAIVTGCGGSSGACSLSVVHRRIPQGLAVAVDAALRRLERRAPARRAQEPHLTVKARRRCAIRAARFRTIASRLAVTLSQTPVPGQLGSWSAQKPSPAALP